MVRTTIGRLFGHSPFSLLQSHMEEVERCVIKMGECLLAAEEEDWTRVEALARETSEIEHQADLIKEDIRNHHIKKGLFMPVDRYRLLEILAIQDRLADVAEDVTVLVTYRPIAMPEDIKNTFQRFLELNLEAFRRVARIIGRLDELLQTGFGGAEAEKVRGMVQEVAKAEHEADLVQQELLKAVFRHESEMTFGEFYLWMRLTRALASLSNQSENLANRVEAALELK